MISGKERTKHNLLYMLSFFQQNCPITVGQYLDKETPNRRTDPEHGEYAQLLFNTLVLVSKDDLFDMDLPVTEASVIRGFTPTGQMAIKIVLAASEAGLI